MGHADLRGTQYYLRLTADAYPEVMARAQVRFGYDAGLPHFTGGTHPHSLRHGFDRLHQAIHPDNDNSDQPSGTNRRNPAAQAGTSSTAPSRDELDNSTPIGNHKRMIDRRLRCVKAYATLTSRSKTEWLLPY
jgi:hypothetical protein